MLASLFDSSALMGGVIGGISTIVVLGLLFLYRVKFLEGSKWGANFSEVECPECGNELPRVRAPKNLRQMLWGGWTCSECGKEYDKWLNPVGEKSKNPENDSSASDKG